MAELFCSALQTWSSSLLVDDRASLGGGKRNRPEATETVC